MSCGNKRTVREHGEGLRFSYMPMMYGQKCQSGDHGFGELAQMVERSLSMREVGGSMPPFSTPFVFGINWIRL